MSSNPHHDHLWKSVVPEISQLLTQRMGLKPEVQSELVLMRALRQRARVLDITDPVSYLKRLKGSSSEFQELVELMVVPETWFFRDRAAFDFLTSQVRAEEAEGRVKPWSILSLACATGEEVYSLVISMFEAGVPSYRLSVEGVDISQEALAEAEAAQYSPTSFRDPLSGTRMAFFERYEGLWRLRSEVRKCVRFHWDNVVAPHVSQFGQKYDVVFCRNLLIYLNDEAQHRLLQRLHHGLAEEGLVVVAPAERELVRMSGFLAVGPAPACAFRARVEQEVESVPVVAQAVPVKAKHEVETPPAEANGPTLNPAGAYEYAKQQADEGNVIAAMDVCRASLVKNPHSIELHFLMGILHLSNRAEDEARYHFERVVYLEPTHYEALVNLALIDEGQGQKDQAARYWRRARRCQAEMAPEAGFVEGEGP